MEIVQSCQGLILVIVLLAGLHLETNDQWKKVINVMEMEETGAKFSQYNVNVYNTIMMCINSLETEKKELFQLLGVFKRIPITFRSIMCLWNRNEAITSQLLRELDSKALLTFHDDIDINSRLEMYLHLRSLPSHVIILDGI